MAVHTHHSYHSQVGLVFLAQPRWVHQFSQFFVVQAATLPAITLPLATITELSKPSLSDFLLFLLELI